MADVCVIYPITAQEREGKVAEAKQMEALSIAELMACEELKHISPAGGAASSNGMEEEETGKKETVKECRMCQWVGRCPRESKLEPQEFEAAVRAIARYANGWYQEGLRHVSDLFHIIPHRDEQLGMTEKSKAVQVLRSCSWSGSQLKRPKPGVVDAGPGGLAGTAVTAKSSTSAAAISQTLGARADARVPGNGAGGAFMMKPSVDEMSPSYTDSGELGCRHYRRACKLRAECCGRLFTCRLCHDECTPDHAMDRYAVKEVLCMRCGELQPVGQYCQSEACQGKLNVDPAR